MRYVLALAVVLGLTACGQANSPDYPGFEGYVDGFLAEGLKRGKNVPLQNLTIKFEDLGLNTYADCYMGRAEIRINKLLFGTLNAVEKEIVLYHEMGHCLLDLDHDKTKISIMNPFLIRYVYYLTYKEQLLNDLFGGPIL